jgi:hypothetical protein
MSAFLAYGLDAMSALNGGHRNWQNGWREGGISKNIRYFALLA